MPAKSKEPKVTAVNGQPVAVQPTSTPTGIPIHCLFDKMIPAKELTANPKNYRKHPDSHVQKLCGIIRENGWRKPVVVSRLSGLIVTGHGATLAGMAMDDSVPVEYQDFASAAAEKRALVADNKASDGAKDDDAILAQLLKELEGVTPDGIGMTLKEMEELTAIANGTSTPKGSTRSTPKAVISYNLIFDNLGQQERFYAAVNSVKESRPDLATFAARLDHILSTIQK